MIGRHSYRAASAAPRPVIRAQLEAAIQRAIDALDAFDGDPDLEDQCEDEGADTGDREPSLGWRNIGGQDPTTWDGPGLREWFRYGGSTADPDDCG